MLEIEEMKQPEIAALLLRIGYAHLAFSRNNHPYIIPIHYEFHDDLIYVFTSEGKKTDFLAQNAEVCLQVEEVQSATEWRSVIVNGRAQRITDPAERQRVIDLMRDRNPTLAPAVSRTWKDTWGFQHIEVMLRITPEKMSGRKTRSQSSKLD